MTIIIFIIILAILIVVHELGHFIVAKRAGIRVDEFGLGFPPRAKTLFKKGETSYTLNWIPFGGFVKIFGENPDEEALSGPDKARSLIHKPKWIQALVMVAGVSFNLIFAWLLISAGYMSGLPTPVDNASGYTVQNPKLIITAVSKGSPAEKSGVRVGDTVLFAKSGADMLGRIEPAGLQQFISGHQKMDMGIERGSRIFTANLTPEDGLVSGRKAVGISMDMIGTLQLPVHKALWEGLKTTVDLTYATAVGLGDFFLNIVRGNFNFSQVTGPVGIVGLVGDASKLGFIYLLSFTAFISINLAVINLIPFPALDGGRLLFILIEAIKGSRISPKIANAFNAVGFVVLLSLMAVITFHDIFRIFVR